MTCPRGERPGLSFGATHERDGCEICPCGKFSNNFANSNCDPVTSCTAYTCASGRLPSSQGLQDKWSGCVNCPAGRYQPNGNEGRCINAMAVNKTLAAVLLARASFETKAQCRSYFKEGPAVPWLSGGKVVCDALFLQPPNVVNCTFNTTTMANATRNHLSQLTVCETMFQTVETMQVNSIPPTS